MPQRQRVRELGPCFRCRCPGHIAVNCTTPVGQYPLPQPVVSSAEILRSGSAEPADVYVCKKGVDDVTAEPVAHQGGAKKVEAYNLVMHETGVNDQHTELEESTWAITKYWEVENEQFQITDVQGRLKTKVLYWKEVLHAPPPILDCIENGYRLPLKVIPPPYFQENHDSAMVNHSFVDEAIKGLFVESVCN